MYDVGRFRVITTEDLAKFRYDGDLVAMRKDVSFLERRGLLKRDLLVSLQDRPRNTITLTEEGLHRIRSLYYKSGQKFYRGSGHPAQLDHDARLYPMYHAEAAALREAGMKIRNVRLDPELQSKFKKETHEAGKSWSNRMLRRKPADIRQRVATANGLELVDGKVQFPDARIEFEKPDGELGRVDLELVTEHYTRSMIAAKQSAGMKIYGQHTPTWGPQHDVRIAEKTFRI